MIKLSNSNIIKTIALCLLLQSNGMPPKNNAPAQKADEFYVFNVGQGNCNLFIPVNKKSGIILYDAGSTKNPFNDEIERTDVDINDIFKTIRSGFKDRKKHLEVVVSHADLDHLKFIKDIVEALIAKDEAAAEKEGNAAAEKKKLKKKLKMNINI